MMRSNYKIKNKMKKVILTLSLMMMFLSSCSQNNQKLIGVYAQDNTWYYILPDSKFIIVAYGTIIYGKWEVDDKNNLVLIPHNPEHRFMMYGRSNPNIKNGYKVMFQGFEDDETFIGNEITKMYNIFNSDAGCFSFPYIHKFNKKNELINLGYSVYDESQENNLYSFLTTNYNDFILSYISKSQFYKPFYFKILKEGIQKIGRDKGIITKKTLESLSNEDKKMIKEINASTKWDDIKSIVVNSSYKVFENNIIKDKEYVFDNKENAYINKLNHNKNSNRFENYNEYNDSSIIYKYDKIEPEAIRKSSFKKTSQSLFHVVCDNIKVDTIN
jgi:hypothetical protein